MKKVDSFIHKYPVSKSLRFELVPVDNTLKNLNTDMVIESDVKRSEKYKKG